MVLFIKKVTCNWYDWALVILSLHYFLELTKATYITLGFQESSRQSSILPFNCQTITKKFADLSFFLLDFEKIKFPKDNFFNSGFLKLFPGVMWGPSKDLVRIGLTVLINDLTYKQSIDID